MAELDLWWLTPLILALVIGMLCPATGALLITQRRILLANLMAHSVLPGLVLAWPLGLIPRSGACAVVCWERSWLNVSTSASRAGRKHR